jgi:hypothetical protein
MSRRSLSKTLRFEVFKRDGFTCQYCGATPPAVVLEVDHIEAVAAGGSDDQDNLITACFDCNRGKGARDLRVAPETLAEKAERIAEAEAQLAAFREVMEALEARKEADVWIVVDALFGETETTHARFNSIKMFLDRLPVWEVKEAAQIARGAKPWSEAQRFKYFCGVCWNKIKGANDGQD